MTWFCFLLNVVTREIGRYWPIWIDSASAICRFDIQIQSIWIVGVRWMAQIITAGEDKSRKVAFKIAISNYQKYRHRSIRSIHLRYSVFLLWILTEETGKFERLFTESIEIEAEMLEKKIGLLKINRHCQCWMKENKITIRYSYLTCLACLPNFTLGFQKQVCCF